MSRTSAPTEKNIGQRFNLPEDRPQKLRVSALFATLWSSLTIEKLTLHKEFDTGDNVRRSLKLDFE
ncbi:putative sulfite oxidase cytochrome subunit [Roseibium sp. TrichSKD4]|nr:putative sulfite oxidase cytochrome subunit [Roseibium sp. TrichSKD4]